LEELKRTGKKKKEEPPLMIVENQLELKSYQMAAKYLPISSAE
jgi:hypothetical protein